MERLALLLYADDIVVLANSADGLQRMMKAVERFCKRWRLQVNMGKTKVVGVGVRGEYKYLGMLVEKGGSSRKNKDKMLRKARRAAALAWNMPVRMMSVKGMTSMWNALVRPHLEYGAEVLNSHNDFVWEEAEKLARKIAGECSSVGNGSPTMRSWASWAG